MTAPVATVADAVVISLIGGIVGNLQAGYGIRIEVVVNMQTVNIIACHDVANYFTDVVTILFQGGIQQGQSVIAEATLRILNHHMVGGIGMGRLGLGTIGINPGMQLHATLMALFYHPCQRIPIGLWSLPLYTCQIIAPRLYRTLIQGITLWSHLEDNGIATIFLQLVQLVAQRLLHLLGGHALKLSVDTLYPCTTKLTFLLCLHAHAKQQQGKYQ